MRKRTMPVDRRQPTDCKNGWFYVNEGSITVVRAEQSRGCASVSRRQMLAALKLMRQRRTSDRGGK